MALPNKNCRNRTKISHIKYDILQLFAIILVILLATFLQASAGMNSHASINSSSFKTPELQITLAPDQPVQVIESYNQWIASFVLSTDSKTLVEINAITFWPQGNLERKMLSYHQIYPIRIEIDGELAGEGSGWLKEFLYIENEVLLETPIIVSLEKPVIINVYVDLPYTYQKRFGVYVSNIETELLTNVELPIKGFLYAIRNRLGQK